MGNVVVFAPSPVLSVTVEDQDDAAEVHVHAAGQGVWQTRMLRALGAEVTMCSVLAGETGGLLKYLLEDEGIRLLTVDGTARSGAGVTVINAAGGKESAGSTDRVVGEADDLQYTTGEGPCLSAWASLQIVTV